MVRIMSQTQDKFISDASIRALRGWVKDIQHDLSHIDDYLYEDANEAALNKALSCTKNTTVFLARFQEILKKEIAAATADSAGK